MIANRVSVVIPCYNGARFLRDSIPSVLAQTYPAHEIVVVDDGSTDDTTEVALSFADRGPVIVHKQPNGGLSAARNAGVTRSSGDLIAFLDADDVWHPRKLELQVRAIQDRPEFGLIATDVFEYPNTGCQTLNPPADPPPVAVASLADILTRNASFVPSSVMVRREIFIKIGGFDPLLRQVEDWDCFLRIASVAPVCKLPVYVTGYRSESPGSLSKKPQKMKDGMRTVFRKLGKAGVWRGRPLTRLLSYSMYHQYCAYLFARYGSKPDRWLGLYHALMACFWYPVCSRSDLNLRIRLVFGQAYTIIRRK